MQAALAAANDELIKYLDTIFPAVTIKSTDEIDTIELAKRVGRREVVNHLQQLNLKYKKL